MNTIRIDEYRELYAFNRWANQRMLDAAGSLTFEQFVQDLGSSFPSVRDTLVHIMSAEWIWLARWSGQSPTGMPAAWQDLDLFRLRRDWSRLDAQLQEFVAGLDDDGLDRTVAYRNIAGESLSSLQSHMLRHLVNHSTYHRGQVTTLLRQLGATAPATDLIAFHRGLAEAVSPGEQ